MRQYITKPKSDKSLNATDTLFYRYPLIAQTSTLSSKPLLSLKNEEYFQAYLSNKYCIILIWNDYRPVVPYKLILPETVMLPFTVTLPPPPFVVEQDVLACPVQALNNVVGVVLFTVIFPVVA